MQDRRVPQDPARQPKSTNGSPTLRIFERCPHHAASPRKPKHADRPRVHVTRDGHDPFLFERWPVARHFELGKGMTFAPSGATGRVCPVRYVGCEFCGPDTNAMPNPAM
jgi:hypothetical protein